MNCKICNKEIYKKQFPQHLRKYHNEEQESYTFKYLFNGINPLCKCGCGQPTKYVLKEYRYNDHVHNHHRPTLGKVMSNQTKDKIAERQRSFQASLSTEQRKERIEIAREIAIQRNLQKYGVENIFSFKKFVGKNNSGWKGGIGKLDQIIYSSHKLYKLWKYPILLRDKFKCCKCEELLNLHVHHDKQKMTEIVLLFVPEDKHELTYEERKIICNKVIQYHIDNQVSGITLCKSCHKSVHNS